MNLTFFPQQMANKLLSRHPEFEPLFRALHSIYENKAIDQKSYKIMEAFAYGFIESALEGGTSPDAIIQFIKTYVERLFYLSEHPFSFKPYHKQVTEPFDYHNFGMDFVRALINSKVSQYLGLDYLNEIQHRIDQNHNVILLANHQTELDPQCIEFLIEKEFPKLAKDMIFVAGDRVILDKLAVPVSMGRNLLCIYSKKHIDNPPSQTEQKRHHNKKTMELMSDLLKEGGKCIYVASSGGRDRSTEGGYFPIAQLDPQGIELFYIMAKKSKVPTHFHSLALLTNRIFPPPSDVKTELGEERRTSFAGVYGFFGKEVDMEHFAHKEIENKIEKRLARADFIWNQINEDYQVLIKLQEKYEQ
jgi:glycerol-3-phosphate O-acyltransferase